mmetsp:Transcript_36060/g.63681  ORF Transcript_36060/g.63681 Transcript_36060/m.63681 type:complete len:129 (+) Transcript_36060:1839-2225(+)
MDEFTVACPDVPIDDRFAEDPVETYVLFPTAEFTIAGIDAPGDDTFAGDAIKGLCGDALAKAWSGVDDPCASSVGGASSAGAASCVGFFSACAENPIERCVFLFKDVFANAGPDAALDDPFAEDPIVK